MSYSDRLHKVIPSGAHTYSRADDQFPSNAPQILKAGKGAYVVDMEGKQYLDYGMGLRAVGVGYAEDVVDRAAIHSMAHGNCLTRPSYIELEAAELACGLLGLDQVKFTKNGSTATTAAVKLARVATKRQVIARARQPFFSYDDWFIGNTTRNKGCGNGAYDTIIFDDAVHLDLLARRAQIACAILEPKDYDLKAMREVCDRHGIVLIFDEMITGFRYDWPSVAQCVGVKPDLSCFGKAMANGFSVACVGGRREIMELGARPDVFLASTTHGAEMCGLGAFKATVEFYQKHDVSKHLREYKAELDKLWPVAMPEKTLFAQEMCRRGILIPWVAHSYRHGEKELAITKQAIEGSMEAIANGIQLEGAKIRPVFS